MQLVKTLHKQPSKELQVDEVVLVMQKDLIRFLYALVPWVHINGFEQGPGMRTNRMKLWGSHLPNNEL